MRKSEIGLLCLVVLGLSACPAPPVGAPVPLPTVPTRDFLYSNQQPSRQLRAAGFVVFTTSPSPQQRPRYRAFCNAYLRNLQPSGGFPGGTAVVTTFWPLTIPTAQGTNLNCERLLANYDYTKGALAAAEAEVLGSTGPLLMATTNPAHFANQRTFVLDLATTDTTKLDSVFGVWRARVVQSPNLWGRGSFWTQFANDTISTLNQVGAAFGFKDLKSIWSVFTAA